MNIRKQLLLDTALSLFIEQGFAHTTIQMILDKSGVSKGTFYKFFNSKNDCILAILEQYLQEDIILRKNLEASRYASDFELLVDQIAIPMSLPDKERVWELFWTCFYTGEVDYTHLARIQLNWLAERLVQLFGRNIEPYALEGAVLCYGMLHQISSTWRNFHHQQPEWKEVVIKAIRYVEVLMRTMHERQEHFFDFQSLMRLGYSESRLPDKQLLLEELQEFSSRVQRSKESPKVKELILGLVTLFEQEELNRSLVEVVLKACQLEVDSTPFGPEARRLAKECWWFLERSREQEEK